MFHFSHHQTGILWDDHFAPKPLALFCLSSMGSSASATVSSTEKEEETTASSSFGSSVLTGLVNPLSQMITEKDAASVSLEEPFLFFFRIHPFYGFHWRFNEWE